jgi:rRNA maturation protein Nop10
MKIRKCIEHGYTFEEECIKCGKKTLEAHYKFIGLRDIKEKEQIL